MLLFPVLAGAWTRPVRPRVRVENVLVVLRELVGFTGLALWIAGSLAGLAMLPS